MSSSFNKFLDIPELVASLSPTITSTMKLASARVFGIPELASIIASFLDKKDLTHVMLTSRHMHVAIEPWFYHDLRTYNNNNNKIKGLGISLCDSPEGLRALSRNIHCVRIWESDLFNLVFISHASVAIQQYPDLNNNNNNNSIDGDDDDTDMVNVLLTSLSSFLTWARRRSRMKTRSPLTLQMIKFDLLRLVPLPPVMLLSRLSLSLPYPLPNDTQQQKNSRNHTLPRHADPLAAIVRVCLILSRLPKLRVLSLDHLLVMDPRSIQLLTSTLLRMVSLRRLQLEVVSHGNCEGAALSLFFGCPPSVEGLRIAFITYPGAYYTSHDSDSPEGFISEGDTNKINTTMGVYDDFASGAVFAVEALQAVAAEGPARRTVPLVNLRELSLEMWRDDVTPEVFLSVFESCPGLEKLILNWVWFPDEVDGADIGRLCPNLRAFSCLGQDEVLFDKTGPLGIMETLPENQLKALRYYGAWNHSVDGVVAGKTLLRHTGSLRQVNISSSITSAAIQMILATCRILEELHISNSSINLIDAATSPWAGSKMTHLTLDVNISLPSDPDTHYKPFYLQTPPLAPSQEENRIFAQLETFYRQIGKQASLKYLKLTRVGYYEGGAMALGKDDQEQPLPGFLRLSGGSSSEAGMDRPGYLELLGGLRRLAVIEGGGIRPETKDGKMPAHAMEVDWIRVHWPLLRKASFSFASRWPEDNFSL